MMDTQRYNALIDQAAHALKDSDEKAGNLIREAVRLHGGDLFVARCAVRDDVGAPERVNATHYRGNRAAH